MATRFGLSEDDIARLWGVFERYSKIDQVLLYGSRAKGNYRPGSDIDLTLMGEIDWPTFNQLTTELDDLLLPYQIDLSIYQHIDNDELKAHIQRHGQVMYARPESRKPEAES